MNRSFSWPKTWIAASILVFLLTQMVSSAEIQGIPIPPNDSTVTARVLEYSIVNSTLEEIKPEQILFALRILVLSSESKEGKIDFTQSEIGQVIKVYSKKMLSAILFGKTIQANVSLSGDERGGKYWIRDIQLRSDG